MRAVLWYVRIGSRGDVCSQAEYRTVNGVDVRSCDSGGKNSGNVIHVAYVR